MPYSDVQVAAIVHEAFRAMQALEQDDMPAQPWFWEPRSVRQRTVNGVARVRGSGMSAQQNHEHWLADMYAAGWARGDEKDPEKLTHPDLVPWHDLPENIKRRARVFVALVRELSEEEEAA